MQLLGLTAVVFDFDGTLATCPYDFAYMRRAIEETAHTYGLRADALGDAGLLEAIELGARLLGEDQLRSERFRTEAMARLSAIEYDAAACTELLPGVIAALERMRKAGYRLGIVTRNSAAAVARIIGEAPLPFDAILCREDVRQPKPHTAHVLEMLHALGSTPALALMVGDHPMDIEMGKAAGMRTVAVLTGQSTAAQLRAAEPDLLLPSVMELSPMLPPSPGTGLLPEGSVDV